MSGRAIGIDLGTTNSCVAVLINDKVEIIANDFGKRTTPSCVAFIASEEEEVVGHAAQAQASRNPANTICEVKRLMGRKWNDDVVQMSRNNVPYKIVNEDGGVKIKVLHGVKEKIFSPAEISAMILKKMKALAETFLNKNVTDAVITHPAYFTDPQKRATKEAAELAGLRVLRMIPEPSAAALAYGVDRKDLSSQRPRKVLIYDLGGGTFDVTVATVQGAHVEVIAVDGNSRLGGYDFNSRLFQYVAKELLSRQGLDVANQPSRLMRLSLICEEAKRELSALNKVDVDLEAVVGDEFSIELSRCQFETLCSDLIISTMETVRDVLKSAQMTPGDVDEVILVGGATRMPCVVKMLQGLFPGKAICQTVNPDEAVAYGAAMLAARLASIDSSSSSGDGGGGAEDDTLCSVMVQNVTPLSIGISVEGGSFFVMLPRNSKIPASKQTILRTCFNGQKTVALSIYQGERVVADRNLFIGRYSLAVPAAAAGLVCDVKLSLDDDGILEVRGKPGASAVWQGCTLEMQDCSASDIVSHSEEAERYKLDDNLEAERLAARFKLQKYLLNHVNEASSIDQRAAFSITKAWFDANRNASTEDFKNQLKDLKTTMNSPCKRPYDLYEQFNLNKRRK